MTTTDRKARCRCNRCRRREAGETAGGMLALLAMFALLVSLL